MNEQLWEYLGTYDVAFSSGGPHVIWGDDEMIDGLDYEPTPIYTLVGNDAVLSIGSGVYELLDNGWLEDAQFLDNGQLDLDYYIAQ